MKTSITHVLLATLPVKGLFLLLLLFFICLIGVHVVQLTRLGWEYQKQVTAPKPEQKEEQKKEKKPPTQPAGEPIYYIVERKTRRARPSYSEPKQIRFKKED